MSLLDDIGKSNGSQSSGPPFLAKNQTGRYVAHVDVMALKDTRKSGEQFKVECSIVESSCEGKPPGTAFTDMQGTGKEGAPDRIAQIMADVVGVDVSELDSKTAAGLLSDDNPARGTFVVVTADIHTTAGGTDIVRCSYQNLNDQAAKPYAKAYKELFA